MPRPLLPTMPARCRLPCPPAHHAAATAPAPLRPRPARSSSPRPLPQGVMLTHESVLAAVNTLKVFMDAHQANQDETDVYLSFLPLAHIFDR